MLTIKKYELPIDAWNMDGDLLQKFEEEHTAVVPRNRSLKNHKPIKNHINQM